MNYEAELWMCDYLPGEGIAKDIWYSRPLMWTDVFDDARNCTTLPSSQFFGRNREEDRLAFHNPQSNVELDECLGEW